MKKTKNNKKLIDAIDISKIYEPSDAIKILKDNSYTKFEESLEVAINLGIDPNKTDQNIRGIVNLPNGSGKIVNVAVLAKADKQSEAKEAGADTIGEADLIENISSGKFNFDILIATPDMMPAVGKVAKVLGPKGLMPNPKVGTVTQDVAKAVENAKAGQVQFRIDKAGVVHCPIGKASFQQDDLKENLMALVGALNKAKPSGAKGQYFKRVTLSTTMGPGVKVDRTAFAG